MSPKTNQRRSFGGSGTSTRELAEKVKREMHEGRASVGSALNIPISLRTIPATAQRPVAQT